MNPENIDSKKIFQTKIFIMNLKFSHFCIKKKNVWKKKIKIKRNNFKSGVITPDLRNVILIFSEEEISFSLL